MLLAGTLFFLFNDNYLSQMERSAEFNILRGNIATQFAAFAYLLRQWALPLWLNIDPDLPLLLALAAELALLLNTRTFRIGNYSGTAAFLLPLAGKSMHTSWSDRLLPFQGGERSEGATGRGWGKQA